MKIVPGKKVLKEIVAYAIAASAVLIPLGLALFIIHQYVETKRETVRDCYALDAVAMAIEFHLKKTDGEWPKGWTELEPSYSEVADDLRMDWPLEEIQKRVWIDFNYGLDFPSFSSFGLISERKVFWGSENPVGRVEQVYRAKNDFNNEKT